ncbi:MAG: S8 family serine peptidase [Actinomycetota bacterium]|nr:S8 family serine peptidase [Actinomycetota bacterium]
MRGRKLLRMGGAIASLLAAASLIVVAAGSAASRKAGISHAAATSLAANATSRVIIVLKKQVTSTPATPALAGSRKAQVQRAQAPLLQTLAQAGATSVHSYSILDAVSATVPTSDVSALKGNPAVAEVVPDATIPLPNPTPATSTAGAAATPFPPGPGVCAPPGQVQLNPQALEAIHANSDVPGAQTARSLGITGAGVKVAWIADGIDINNPNYIRPNGQHVFFDYKDFSGQGTGAPTGGIEANLDAGSIAAQGNTVYNVSTFSPLGVNRPCRIRIEGVAPGASLAGLDIFGTGGGLNSSFLQAIDYAVTVDHVNVLNESLGSNPYPDDQAALDLIKRANDQAVAAGTTVVVSSGDAGVTSTIGAPASDPNVIAAGASTTYRLFLQDGYGGARFPGVAGWLDNNISSLSSGGVDQDGQTIDLVAPGELNWVTCSKNTAIYRECVNYNGQPTDFYPSGGTSESAPLTSGTAALVIQAYRTTHHGATPTPAQVKEILTSTANDIGAPADQQGAGLLDAYKAVLAAESFGRGAGGDFTRSHWHRPASTVLTSPSQLDATGQVGTTETLSETVTNNGSRPEIVNLSTRTLGDYTTIKTANVALSDTASPHITDWQGINDNYEPVSFQVPAGANRLNAAIAFKNASASDLNARVRLTLIDPQGRLAAYSVPQGDGNYGNVQVANPTPGTWTGYIYSRDTAHGGTTGPVVFGASVASYTSFGTVSPRWLFLRPGASRDVTLTVDHPSHPGDAAGAIVLRSSSGGFWFGGESSTTTVPVILRSLIPTGPTSFSGLLTGGNGRQLITGQSNYYRINIPSGQPALNATVTLADNPNNPLDAWLVNPAGQAEAFSANNELISTPSGPAALNTLGAQLHVVSPAAGTWTLIVAFAPQVSGVALSEPFTVSIDENAPKVSATGLPDSATTTLPAGKPVTVPVSVTNNGTSPEAVFIDPRLSSSTQYNLVALDNPTTTVPYDATVNPAIPVYLVPSDSTSMTGLAQTSGSQPIQFDSSSPVGDPDLGSNQGLSVSATINADPLTPGAWGIAPTEVGPFGAAPAPKETVNTAMLVTAPAFDPAVTSDTGDLWLTSVDPTATFSTVTINPGETKIVNVTITPAGPAGTVVSGKLYVDDAQQVVFDSILSPNANQIAALSYHYTIG